MGVEGFKILPEDDGNKKSSMGRHGPKGRERNFITEALATAGRDVPDYILELDRAIAAYAQRHFDWKTKFLNREIAALTEKEKSLRDDAHSDASKLKAAKERLEDLKAEKKNLYKETYIGTWNRILTRNGARHADGLFTLPDQELFPSRQDAERLTKVSRYEDPFMLDRIVQGAIADIWPRPAPASARPARRSLFEVIAGGLLGRKAPVAAIEAREAPAKDVPLSQQNKDVPQASEPILESSMTKDSPEFEPENTPVTREFLPVSPVEPEEKTQPEVIEGSLEPEIDPEQNLSERPLPLASPDSDAGESPEGQSLVPVSSDSAPPVKKHWARRALGAAFNMAAGAGAGVAVKTSVLALTGGSVVAAMGAGAAFSGLLSVGRQHSENVRARKAKDPQAQGWAVHREVFAQNKKSYLNRFLTSAAIFAGGGALGYAYGEQIVDWVSGHVVEPVANLFHSAASEGVPAASPVTPAEIMPLGPVPDVQPLEAVPDVPVSAPPVETLAPAVPEASVPSVHETVPVAPSDPVTPEPDSRALMMENVQRLIGGEQVSSPVQDALRRAASENPRIGAQGLKDLGHFFANGAGGVHKDPAVALRLFEESLKVNPANAQANLAVAYYETHGIGEARVDLPSAYEKAAQVQTSPQADTPRKVQAEKLLDYITRTLGFRPS